MLHLVSDIPPVDAPALPNYLGLGATLYVPATHPDLAAVLAGQKVAEARSIAVCLEDAVREDELPRAIDNFERALAAARSRSRRQGGRLCFARPRSPALLLQLARMPDITAIDGFILPKADAENIDSYLDAAAAHPSLLLMPTIETTVAFSRDGLSALAERLHLVASRVLAVRIGGNDLLSILGIRRTRGQTIYDTPLRSVIDDVLCAFKPRGFEVSAPVLDIIDDTATLEHEVGLDVARGLLAKTAIHPSQIAIIEAGYRPCASEVAEAERLVDAGARAVFRLNGRMCETSTHTVWAENTLLRAKLYGVNGVTHSGAAHAIPPTLAGEPN